MKLAIFIEGGCLTNILALREPTDYNPATARLACAVVDYDNLEGGADESDLPQAYPLSVTDRGTVEEWIETMSIGDSARAVLRRALDIDNDGGT